MATVSNITGALPGGTVLRGGRCSYTLLKTLGQGSFGITYLAKNVVGDDEVEQLFCIKEFFMRDINGRDDTAVTSSNREGMFDYYKRKFEQESDHLRRLRDRHIVMVVDAFRENSTSYYVMQYIDGLSLDQLIAKMGRLTVDEALDITRQIGSALQTMHSKGMLHLDVKPANVMMADPKTAVLIDFGLSKQYDKEGQPESSTTVGSGTPGYAPIEQANHREGQGFPVQMDVYALGATLFKMLTGHRAPEASDILNSGFPEKELLKSGVPQGVVAVVRKAMEPQRGKRYQTVAELVAAANAAGGQKEESTIVDNGSSKQGTDNTTANTNSGSNNNTNGGSSWLDTTVKWLAGMGVLMTVTSIPDIFMCNNLGKHGGKDLITTFFNNMFQGAAPFDWMWNVIDGRCDSFGYLLGLIFSTIGVAIAYAIMNRRWKRTLGETLWHDRIWLVVIGLGINALASMAVPRPREYAIIWAVFLQASFCALGTIAFMKKSDNL